MSRLLPGTRRNQKAEALHRYVGHETKEVNERNHLRLELHPAGHISFFLTPETSLYLVVAARLNTVRTVKVEHVGGVR